MLHMNSIENFEVVIKMGLIIRDTVKRMHSECNSKLFMISCPCCSSLTGCGGVRDYRKFGYMNKKKYIRKETCLKNYTDE